MATKQSTMQWNGKRGHRTGIMEDHTGTGEPSGDDSTGHMGNHPGTGRWQGVRLFGDSQCWGNNRLHQYHLLRQGCIVSNLENREMSYRYHQPCLKKIVRRNAKMERSTGVQINIKRLMLQVNVVCDSQLLILIYLHANAFLSLA